MDNIKYNYQGPLLKRHGRYYLDDKRGINFFTFSGSGFEVRFNGTFLKCRLIATECGKSNGEASIEVEVDNAGFFHTREITLACPDAEVFLASNLCEGEHVVRVYKRTEASCSFTGFTSITTDGIFLPVDDSKHLKIEFFGDSITAGNGDEGIEGDNEYETRTENALTSYGALTCEKLKADFSLVAIGGFGLYKSPWNKGESINCLPMMFSLANFSWGMNEQNSIKWDHFLFVPDITVISLGTNDDEYLDTLEEPKRTEELLNFKEALVNFIKLIKKTSPKTKIILTIGMIHVNRVDKAIKEVADEISAQDVYFLYFDTLKVGGFMANGGHPNQKMHIKAAEELTELIKKII